jgi:hypothetical protein
MVRGGENVLDKIVSNISRAAHYFDEGTALLFRVLQPGNIPDLYQVYEFAQQGVLLAVCPELRGVKAPQECKRITQTSMIFLFPRRMKEGLFTAVRSSAPTEILRDSRAVPLPCWS